jgi:hypothetical protein
MVGSTRTRIEEIDTTGRSPVVPVAQAAIAAVLGVFVLPSLFGALSPIGFGLTNEAWLEPLLWLGTAALLVVWLVALAPSLADFLTSALASVPWHARTTDDRPGGSLHFRLVAMLLVIGVDLALFELITRRPLVAVVGAYDTTVPVDAIVASVTLVALFAVLLRLYLAGRPFLEAGAWYVLDTVVPTVSSDAASRFDDVDTTAPSTVTADVPRAPETEQDAARTVAATIVATVLASEGTTAAATIVAPIDPTVPAPATVTVSAPADPTVATIPVDEPTILVPTSDAEETLTATIPTPPAPA